MKILFASFTYYPANNGVANVTKYLAEGLARKGHEIFVITQGNKSTKIIDNTLEQNGVKICFLSATSDSGLKKEYFLKISDIKPDVFICVCTQTWTFDWLYDADWEKLFGNRCKTILYTHGFSGLYEYPAEPNSSVIYLLKKLKFQIKWKMYYKKHVKLMNRFDTTTHVSTSNRSYDFALKNGIERNVVIGNAVDDLFFDTPSYDFERKDGVIRFVYVANYMSLKNQKALLEAYYRTKTSNTEMIFIGSGKNLYYDELLRLNDELRIGRHGKKTSFLTGLSKKQIAEWMSRCDICVMASLREAYSISLLEALAKGLPVISTNVGNAHLIPGVIITESENEMIYMMDWLCERPQLRQTIGKLNREYAENNARVLDKVDTLEKIIL